LAKCRYKEKIVKIEEAEKKQPKMEGLLFNGDKEQVTIG